MQRVRGHHSLGKVGVVEVHRRAGGSGRDGSERLGDDGQIERELEREEVERIEWAEYVKRLEGGEDEDTIVDWRRGRSWRYSGSSFFFFERVSSATSQRK